MAEALGVYMTPDGPMYNTALDSGSDKAEHRTQEEDISVVLSGSTCPVEVSRKPDVEMPAVDMPVGGMSVVDMAAALLAYD